MQYYDDNYRAGKRAGVIATSAYTVVLAVLLLVVKIALETPDTGGEGLLIALGDREWAGGDISTFDMVPADEILSGEDNPIGVDANNIATQDLDEDAAVVQPRERQPERTQSQSQQQTAPPVVEQPRQPDQRALFPGNTQQSTSGSQGIGTGEGEGRQGAPDGAIGGDPDGTGGGGSGTGTGHQGSGFSLAGRSIIGSLAQPRYGPNKSGRVVVDITVDTQGNVIRAVHRGQGSTTNDSELITAAVEAAKKARFNVVGGDGLQTGTITYNFILK